MRIYIASATIPDSMFRGKVIGNVVYPRSTRRGQEFDTMEWRSGVALCHSLGQNGSSTSFSQVQLAVWDVSELAVSIYPKFLYNAIGAGGPGRVLAEDGTLIHVEFNASALSIPPLNSKTAKVLGIPLPPPLQIDIRTQSLKGSVNIETGAADLKFKALFDFCIGAFYRAPPLQIETTLTTGLSRGDSFQAEGQPLSNGCGKLVGVASVPATPDPWLNAFLMLPSEALAQLAVELTFSKTTETIGIT